MGNGAAATAANGTVPSATLDVVSAALATVLATVSRRGDSTWPSPTPASTTTITTPSTTTPQPNDVDPGIFIYGFCLVLIPTATILGNLLVIISVLRFKALHSAINFLILGLAVADLLVALFVMPYAVYVYVQGGAWYLGPLMCDIYSASDVACSTASILLLAVISFDRYRAVSRPIQYSRQSQNIRRVVIILIIIWLISLAIASPIVLGVNYRPPDAEPNECRFYNPEFSIGSSIVSFVIPCFIVLFVYIRIMMALRKRERAAKMRRVANQQETNKVGDMSTDENDAGQIVTAPAINMLMLALPTIQRRMRRFDRHQRAVQEAVREIDIPLHQNPIDEIVRHPGALTSSALGEDLDYVDVDSIIDSQDGRNLRLASGDSFIRQNQRSPVPYSEETTSSATDFVQTQPMHSSSLDANSEINEEMKMSTATEDSNRGLIIENTVAIESKITPIPETPDEPTPKEIRKASRANGRPYGNEPNSPSVTFKIPANETKKMRRLSSAMDVLETTKLLNRSETNSSDPQNHRPSMRTMSQKLTTSTNMAEPSVESAYSSSQSQNTTSIANATSNSGKNLESKLRMVKRAINRKESSLKRKVNKAQRKEKRATKTLGVVVGIFLICWVPFFLINILNAVCIKLNEPRCEVGFEPFFYATWIGYMNSFMNPVIYTIFNTEFRRAFKSLILGRAKGRRHRARPV